MGTTRRGLAGQGVSLPCNPAGRPAAQGRRPYKEQNRSKPKPSHNELELKSQFPKQFRCQDPHLSVKSNVRVFWAVNSLEVGCLFRTRPTAPETWGHRASGRLVLEAIKSTQHQTARVPSRGCKEALGGGKGRSLASPLAAGYPSSKASFLSLSPLGGL